MRFNEILRLLMAEHDVTSRQLAKELRIPRYMLDHFARGTEEPGFDTLKRMAAYFCVSTDYLLDYRGGE